MKTLFYNELNKVHIPKLKKVCAFLEADDFKSADVKKIADNLYRAKLNASDRLLFSIHHHEGEAYALLLEYLPKHSYEKSRFLQRGVTIDESKLPAIHSPEDVPDNPLSYVNSAQQRFHLLDKVISFDDAQNGIYQLPAPLIIIGSAGSGKTALTLEKMKVTLGDILYVTRSPYLAHHARNLYYSNHYENKDQSVDFCSFEEYVETIHVPVGKEVTIRRFSQWFFRHRQATTLKDPYQIFEEFKGVITGSAHSRYLSLEEYLALGIKQSIFSESEKKQVYALFEKYLVFMKKEALFDSNILSFEYLEKVQPRYDFVLVDEVQDLTTVQLKLVLKALRDPTQFFLCGDSNQIVHPNFFSWSNLKSYFYQQHETEQSTRDLLQILHTNYRNSPQVTELANQILRIKQSRFGSIDRESNYLVQSNGHNKGSAVLLKNDPKTVTELDQKIHNSTRFAVIVMYEEQKARVRKIFKTPLVFSIQEAKGLEYDNIVLYNFTSSDENRFREITKGVNHDDLQGELRYRRVKDKSDKSLEIYKFHVNALYVAITRAVKNIYWIEANPKQRIFDLLQIKVSTSGLQIKEQESSKEEWQREAQRLEQQGKQEQAEEIRNQILKQEVVPWKVMDGAELVNLINRAIQKGQKKAQVTLFEFALLHQHQQLKNLLFDEDFTPVHNEEKAFKTLIRKHYVIFDFKNNNDRALKQCEKYGINYRDSFNLTPLMVASLLGNVSLVEALIERGANTESINRAGLNPLRLALFSAIHNSKYRQKKLNSIYSLLEPDCIDIQVDGRMIRIDQQRMEFFLLNLMIVMYYTHLAQKQCSSPRITTAFESGDFVDILKHFPENVLPENRKKRQYISSILSKNEVDREDRYNRKIFKRLQRGHYVLNPQMSVRIDGVWIPMLQLIQRTHIMFPYVDIPENQANGIEEKLSFRMKKFFKNMEEFSTVSK